MMQNSLHLVPSHWWGRSRHRVFTVNSWLTVASPEKLFYSVPNMFCSYCTYHTDNIWTVFYTLIPTAAKVTCRSCRDILLVLGDFVLHQMLCSDAATTGFHLKWWQKYMFSKTIKLSLVWMCQEISTVYELYAQADVGVVSAIALKNSKLISDLLWRSAHLLYLLKSGAFISAASQHLCIHLFPLHATRQSYFSSQSQNSLWWILYYNHILGL